MSVRNTRVLNVSVPPEMYEEIESVAREEHRTKSELIREAFRQYQFNRRWQVLRRWVPLPQVPAPEAQPPPQRL